MKARASLVSVILVCCAAVRALAEDSSPKQDRARFVATPHVWLARLDGDIEVGATIPDAPSTPTTPDAPSSSVAQAIPPTQEGWRFIVAPYVWAVGLRGDIEGSSRFFFFPKAHFSEAFGELDAGFAGVFEARRGDWGVFADIVWLDLSQTTDLPPGEDVHMDLEQTLGTFGALYRIVDGRSSLDVAAGGRAHSVETRLRHGGPFFFFRAQGKESWWDGFLGLRFQRDSRRWSFIWYADVGEGASNATWQIVMGGAYAFNETAKVSFGYRHIYTDFEHEEFLCDLALTGPYLGVALGFGGRPSRP